MWGRKAPTLHRQADPRRARHQPRQSVPRSSTRRRSRTTSRSRSAPIRRFSAPGSRCAAIRIRGGYTDLVPRRIAGAAAHRRDPARASASAKRSRSINQRIFETSLDLILVVDRHGNFLRVSPSAWQSSAIAPEEMIGRSAADSSIPTISRARATRCGWRAAAASCAISNAATCTRTAASCRWPGPASGRSPSSSISSSAAT